MNFLADQDVYASTIGFLRALGHDVVPVAQVGLAQAVYGRGRWRKLKGVAFVRLRTGRIREAELHWYQAHGIGKKEIKRKRYLD